MFLCPSPRPPQLVAVSYLRIVLGTTRRRSGGRILLWHVSRSSGRSRGQPVRSHGAPATTRARELLDGLNLLALDDALLDDAAAIDASKLRSHDAIHIASAQQLQAALDALVTYDESMLTAARAPGLPVSRPT